MDRRLRFVLVYGVAGLIAGLALGAIFDHVGEATRSLPDLVLTGSAVFVLVVGLPVYLYLMSQADAVTHALERLRGFIVMMQTDEVEALPRVPAGRTRSLEPRERNRARVCPAPPARLR